MQERNILDHTFSGRYMYDDGSPYTENGTPYVEGTMDVSSLVIDTGLLEDLGGGSPEVVSGDIVKSQANVYNTPWYVQYDQGTTNIVFADQNVKSICVTNLDTSGDGELTVKEAGAVTSLPVATFRGNTTIQNFNEFKYWTKLTTITAGSSTSALGAFGGCTALKSIEIPSGVTTIGAYAFYGSSALNRIVIPKTVTSFGQLAFGNCSGFNGGNVYYEGSLSQWMNISFKADVPVRYSSPTNHGAHLFLGGEELVHLEIPEGVTTIKQGVFQGLKYITDVQLPSSITSISYGSFWNCGGIVDVRLKNASVQNSSFAYSGNGTGMLEVKSFSGATSDCPNYFRNVLVHSYVYANGSHQAFYGSYIYTVRVNGGFSTGTSGSNNHMFATNTTNVRFVELMGKVTGTTGSVFYSSTGLYNGCILHLGAGEIAGTASVMRASYARVSKYYVGNGTSRANDEAVLALYTADSGWSSYTSKLATWYDYNGTYKWYYVTDNLTNCTNTNPDEWPHITRGGEYRTTIKANAGYTLQSVQVQMYQCEDNTATPDTPTDITSAVYNASTGEIYIQEVVGNVIITASAS